MFRNKKWAKILALALSFPSSILVLSWAGMKLVEKDILSPPVAIFLILAFVGQNLFLIVWYGFKLKKKD